MLNKLILDWNDRLGTADFFKTAFPSLSDDFFLNRLIHLRGRGRNDYPIELLWNAVLTSVACQTPSVEEMRRMMKTWPEIFPKIPSSFAFSRFFSFLCRCSDEIESLLFRKTIPVPRNFGRVMAIAKLDLIHFIWDPQYGLPLLFRTQMPNESPTDVALQLLNRLHELNPALMQRCQYFLGNPSYEGLIKLAWDRFKLRAIIPISESAEATLHPYRGAHYDKQGMVYCQIEGDKRAMIYAGFEKSRNALKYRCMARHYGTNCEKLESCPLRSGLRIPISLDERIFTPLPRTSYRWSHVFSHYETLHLMLNGILPYLRIANQNESKKLLCCRIAALLFTINLGLKTSEKNVSVDR